MAESYFRVVLQEHVDVSPLAMIFSALPSAAFLVGVSLFYRTKEAHVHRDENLRDVARDDVIVSGISAKAPTIPI